MRYKIVPTEYGVNKHKVEREVASYEAAVFATVVSPHCFTIEEITD